MIHSQLSASVWAVSIVFDGCLPSYSVPPVVQESFLGFFSSWAGPSNSRSCPSASRFFPWVFTRVVATLVGHLRQLGLRPVFTIWTFGFWWRSPGIFLEFSSPYDPCCGLGDLGFLVNWVKFFPSLHRDFPFYLGAHFDIPRFVGSAFRAQSFWLFQECFRIFPRVPLAPAPLLAENFFGHLAGFVDLVPLLQAADEASSASSSEGTSLPWSTLRTYLFPWVQNFKVLCVGVVPLLLALLEGKLFCCSSPFIGHLPWTRQVRGGGGSFFTLTVCQGFWSKEEVFDHINTLELKAVLLALHPEPPPPPPPPPRISCGGSFAFWFVSGYMTVVSFIIFSGWNSFLIPVSAGPWTCGNGVFGGEFFSSRGSQFQEKSTLWIFLSRGWLPSYSVGFWIVPFFRPIYRMFFFPFGVSFCSRQFFQFPAPEVPALGARMLWRGKIDALSFFLVGSSTLRVFFPYLFSSGSWTS